MGRDDDADSTDATEPGLGVEVSATLSGGGALLSSRSIPERLYELASTSFPPRSESSPLSTKVFTSLAEGDVLDHYRILGHLGKGGMGHIYRALDLNLEREVAIKVALALVESDSESMLREARALAALNHPNVVTVYEVEIHESRAFIAMELLRGETLRARMVRAAPTLLEALSFACDVLRGLSAAHQARIVHLDVKPENIFITHEGHLKLLDFGVARMKRSGIQDERVIAGTVAYMAPEQLLGDALDFRADLFAFGTILCELVTGRHPFKRDQYPATMYALMGGEYFKDVVFPDPEIEAIVRACMELEPSKRPESAAQLLERLSRVLIARRQVALRSPVAYAETEIGNVAYQMVGARRETDILVVPGLLSRFDMWVNEPEGASFVDSLTRAGRVVLVDRCGFGASDRLSDTSLPHIDEEVEHLDAVLSAAGDRPVVLFALGVGAPLAVLYAALRPERVAGLVIYAGAPAYGEAPLRDRLASRVEHWGTEANAARCAPSFERDGRLLAWLASWERMSASPRIARAWVSLLGRADVRRVLPFVTTKTLVLHREADHFCSPSAGYAFSELGGDVERLVLPGRDHFPGAGAEDVALRVAQFVRECAGAAPEAPGSLATWLLTDIRSSLLPARLSAKLLQEGTPALYRLDRPGAALRWLRELFQRHPGQGKAALACSKRGDDPAQILSELEPLWASARPGEVNATDLAWALIEGTSAFVRARDSMISAAGPIEGDRSSGQTLAEVGPLLHKSFSVCVDGPLRLRIEGVIMLKDPDRQLIPHFRRIHECVVGCGTFELDVRKLSQINSSGIGMFIRWVGWIQAEPPGRRYRLAIHADPSNLWQRGNLMPLSMIAPDVIEIVQGKGR